MYLLVIQSFANQIYDIKKQKSSSDSNKFDFWLKGLHVNTIK